MIKANAPHAWARSPCGQGMAEGYGDKQIRDSSRRCGDKRLERYLNVYVLSLIFTVLKCATNGCNAVLY